MNRSLLALAISVGFVFLGADSHAQEKKDEPKKDEKEPDKKWIDASKDVWEEDGVRVKVVSVSIDFVKGVERDFGEKKPFVSKEKCLIVRLQTENRNETKKIDYTPFGFRVDILVSRTTSMKDNFDNRYNEQVYQRGVTIDGRAKSHSLYPNKSTDDVVVFEVPIEKAKILYLELSKDSIGSKSPPRFQIPMTMVKK